MLQFAGNLPRGLPGFIELIGFERNGRDDGVSTAAVLFTQPRQILPMRARRPWIRSHRHFRAYGRMADPDAVNAVGKQVVRDELVVTVEIVVADIEFNDAVCTFGDL